MCSCFKSAQARKFSFQGHNLLLQRFDGRCCAHGPRLKPMHLAMAFRIAIIRAEEIKSPSLALSHPTRRRRTYTRSPAAAGETLYLEKP
jgi:hypothetical protein